ncbi:asparagine synthase (glutamine-hydrolyzing) [Candidatus Uhrbacteria bacterium]|nr:asparagine synthase (glutamine-hydrolyzing) [Candidatus Uhrbacteria bacterium]
MCGIAGELRFDNQPINEDRLRRMSERIAHRGPDGEGIWMKDKRVGLVHRRLAIVDLSSAGAQPMVSADGLIAITFNGEIYNYQELRDELSTAGVQLHSTSDTEVLLYLYEREGEQMLKKLRGMFAFALWDARRQRLFFACDRVGKKPFYYYLDDKCFSFASELKALTCAERPQIDWEAIRLFLGLQYVPSPKTGFLNYASLPPAHYGIIEKNQLTIKRYDEFSREPKFPVSFEEAAHQVRDLTEESVRLRMIADVPVGGFLSGGVDSSILVSLMARQSSEKIHTFTMGFPSLGFDERAQAKSLADRLGTQHHAFELQPMHVADLVDQMVDVYDAPYADSSCLPTWFLARETRTHVKAVMTGDGGDELFGGYRRYQYFLQATQLKEHGLSWFAIHAGWIMCTIRRDPRWMRFAETLEGLGKSLGQGYADLFTGGYFGRDQILKLLKDEFRTSTQSADAGAFVLSQYQERLGVEGALAFDLASYLPDDLNVKMDRATMAHGLEARAPFLDQELVRFVSHLPLSYILKRGKQKPLLRKAFCDLVPAEIFDRPKRGFQVPLAEWFRKELRPLFVERCLSGQSPLLQICRPEIVEQFLKENDRGVDHGNRLWMLLTLATWLKKYV